MEQKDIKAVYFIGAGGIGMSALARYFMARGLVVAGYDKTPTPLTRQLEREGMLLHYEENTDEIPHVCKNSKACLVVYTPAIPADHAELRFFRDGGFCIEKRAQVLGELTRSHKGLCVAGTHGKTTTSAMCAHIMHQGHLDCNAFLGGIAKNYGTNYILSKSDYVVIEADEYDRSFHWLSPWISVVTATDPDHLDIYGTKQAYLESFSKYTSLIQPGGALIMHTGLEMQPRLQQGVELYFDLCDLKDLPFCGTDLVIVISNLLDNAIRAAAQAKPPEVYLRARRNEEEYLISVRNRVQKDLELVDGELPRSTKAEPGHGMGLVNVREVLDRCRCEYTLSCRDRWFRFTCAVPTRKL